MAKCYKQNVGFEFDTYAANRMIMLDAATVDWELHHVDVEQAFIKALVGEGIYVGLPATSHKFEGDKTKLDRSLYGAMHASHGWNSLLTKELKANN